MQVMSLTSVLIEDEAGFGAVFVSPIDAIAKVGQEGEVSAYKPVRRDKKTLSIPGSLP